MHYISLDAALKNGLPTVLVFATPLLCQSRLCGPVVDEVYDVYDKVGTTRANFVDVEIYPQRDANKPAPEFLKWRFESEPWTVVIDKDGRIRARFERKSPPQRSSRRCNPCCSRDPPARRAARRWPCSSCSPWRHRRRPTWPSGSTSARPRRDSKWARGSTWCCTPNPRWPASTTRRSR